MDRVWMAHSHKVIDWWRMVRVEKGGPTLQIKEFPTFTWRRGRKVRNKREV
jgi:hypothetical protein